MSLPLDIAGGALVAYSNRALSTASKGTALYTIRRSSDNTTQSYSSDATTGDAPTATITTFLGGSDGFVTSWTDQSGNASDAAQATAGSQPGWVASANGGRPGIDFPNLLGGATPIFLSNPSVTLSTGEYTFFAVYKVRNDDPNGSGTHFNFIWALNGAGSSDAEFNVAYTVPGDFTTQYLDLEFSDGTNVAGGASVAGTYGGAYDLTDGEAAFGTVSITRNGASVAVGSDYDLGSALGAISGPLCLGVAFAADPGYGIGNSLYGSLQELIIYPTILSDGTRAAIRSNIASYYGITIAASSARVPGFPPVAEVGTDEAEHRRQLARMFNRLNQGKFNCTV